jgi:diguanylate cyclase (GGDEF)-like protein
VVDIGLATVPDGIRANAEAIGFVTCWAVPVRDPVGRDACIVVWNAEALEPELGQDLLLGRLVSLVELALAGRAHASALDRAANCDPLTGLYNRRYLEAVASRTSGEDTERVAFVLCDLDRFKQVNDVLGHPAGDLVIRTVADRLRRVVREHDVVARFGGDEFAVLCPSVADLGQVERIAARIIDAVCAPIPHGAGSIDIGVSVGAAFAERGLDWDLDHLVRHADEHLLAAKAAGKATFRIGVLEPIA